MKKTRRKPESKGVPEGACITLAAAKERFILALSFWFFLGVKSSRKMRSMNQISCAAIRSTDLIQGGEKSPPATEWRGWGGRGRGGTLRRNGAGTTAGGATGGSRGSNPEGGAGDLARSAERLAWFFA